MPLRAKQLLDVFSRADIQALFLQKLNYRYGLLALVLAVVAGLVLKAYSDWFPTQHWLLLVFPVLIGLVLPWHERSMSKVRGASLKYRVLAEVVRIQLFWDVAGLLERVHRYLQRGQNVVIDWVRQQMIQADAELAIADQPEDRHVEVVQRAASRDVVLQYWVQNQRRYYQLAFQREERRIRLWAAFYRGLLWAVIGISVVLAIALVIPNPLKRLLNDTLAAHAAVHAVLIGSVAFLWSQAKVSQERGANLHLKAYLLEKMLRGFMQAAEAITRQEKAGGNGHALESIRDLGVKQLDNLAEWAALMHSNLV
jgi:hypothetical protein